MSYYDHQQGFTRADAVMTAKETLLECWEKLPDYYDVISHTYIHEVKCRKCRFHETYLGSAVPKICYICEERRYI